MRELHVVVNYNRRRDGAEETQQRIQAVGNSVQSVLLQTDVACEADVNRLLEATIREVGGVDILINNAGYQTTADSHEK
ncbi:MAG: SDR family NAD(P)-dependent oxidoreductase [Planctomycetota bacterium]|nr:SDR family NAD(P)-dependent oxidoreductase [Planctomycetota bacterium]